MESVKDSTTSYVRNFVGSLSRKKSVDISQLKDTKLRRCLNVVDLTSLGVGSTLGAGVYVLIGQVAKFQTGPAIVLSFLIAAVASLLAGLCYAEFSARVPRAGSAYIYSYVSVGELWAFTIGWNMILENMIGAASVGKAWSQYFDSLLNDTIKKTIVENVGSFSDPGLDEFPDFLALALLIAITILVSLGVKMSSVISFVLTILNILVICCIIFVGVFHIDRHNWTDDPGFFPFGFRGVLSGAATCFYAFVGFDTIATSGEEAKDPSRNIPTAIVATLLVCFVAYFGVSAVLTLMVPWQQLSDSAALPKAFAQKGIYGAEYIIAVGGLCGLTAAMMGSIYPLPRTVYAMAQDGLLFKFLGSINSWTNTPLAATWIAGILAAILAFLLDLESLVEMMSIGTLMAYTLVAVSVLVLRHQKEQVGFTEADLYEDIENPTTTAEPTPETSAPEGKLSTQTSVSEDTGLLRVGDKVNPVTYVPSQKTTVFRRVQSEDEPGQKEKKVIVEEIRSKEQDILEKMSSYMSTKQPQPEGYEQLGGSSYSLSSLAQMFNFGDELGPEPTESTRRTAIIALCLVMSSWSCICVMTVYAEQELMDAVWWVCLLMFFFCFVTVVNIVLIVRQPRSQVKLGFRVPFVPALPLASILINIYLMITLAAITWIRFFVWMVIGMLIYCCYGVRHSAERKHSEREVILYDISDQQGILGETETEPENGN